MKRMLPILIALLATILPLKAERLDQAAVGRFAAGKKITANTASQSLLALTTRNAITQMELMAHNKDGKGVSLGLFGFPLSRSSWVTHRIHSIGWTQLTATYTDGYEKVDVLESLLTPVVWFKASGRQLALFQQSSQTSTPMKVQSVTDTTKGIAKPWILVKVESRGVTTPVLVVFHRKPTKCQFNSKGVTLEWSKAGSWVGVLPLNGALPESRDRGENQINSLVRQLIRVPTSLQETYAFHGSYVEITNKLQFDPSVDEWGWGKNGTFAPIPNCVSLAKDYGFEVHYSKQVRDFNYPCFLGPFRALPGTNTIQYSLPIPDLQTTISAPTNDPALMRLMPEAVQKTVSEYSDYIIRTYAKREHSSIFLNSALGEARMLATDYPNLRMMNDEARKVFEKWSDWAISDRTYNFKTNYGYGIEASRNRRFLLDNYRYYGKDYMDAGWFGYSIQAMWARAYYSNKWDEVKANWPKVKELFYGWNWLFTDYVANCSPLLIDADNGGNPKGYTDNMSMLGAFFGWARMALQVGDRPAFNDALYMLAKDRVGRFARMAIHDWTKRCGYDTDVYYLTSDMGNGPNIALTGRYIPAPDLKVDKDVVDYGSANGGLWFISGSYLEPVTSETIDLIGYGPMNKRMESTVNLIHQRYPRWWASPAAGEIANYQIYLLGALFNVDANWLRYVYDYQEYYQQGIWLGESWHGNAFAGIALSRSLGLRHQKNWDISLDSRALYDRNLWRLEDGRLAFSIYLNGKTGTTATISFRGELRKLNQAKWIDLHRSGALVSLKKLSLKPGLNVFAERPTSGLVVRCPIRVSAVVDSPTIVKMKISNLTASSMPLNISGEGCEIKAPTSIRKGETLDIEVTVLGASKSYESKAAVVVVNGKRREIVIDTLPSSVSLLRLSVPKVYKGDQVGKAEVSLVNRLDRPKEITFQWGIDDQVIETKTLIAAANSKQAWELPLEYRQIASGKHTIFAEVVGQDKKQARQIVPSNEVKPMVLYDFTTDTEGWTMPDWPKANSTPEGKKLSPVHSPEHGGVMAVPFVFPDTSKAEGFVGSLPAADWSSFGSISVDVYVPADVPEGVECSFYVMLRNWKWHVPASGVKLKRGAWNHIEAPLRGPAAKAYWGADDQAMAVGLSEVIDVGLRFTKYRGIPGFTATFLVDNVTVVPYLTK